MYESNEMSIGGQRKRMNMHGGRECLNEKMLPPRSEVATQACPDAGRRT